MHHITNQLGSAQCSLISLLNIIQVVRMWAHTDSETCNMLLVIGSSLVKTQVLLVVKTKMSRV